MPDERILDALAAYRRRLRVAGVLLGMIAASAAAGAVLVTLAGAGVRAAATRTAAVLVFTLAGAIVSILAWRRWTLARTARVIEAGHADANNLVITAEEIAGGRAPLPHSVIARPLFDAAVSALDRRLPSAVQPLGTLIAAAMLAVASASSLFVALPSAAPDGGGTTARPTRSEEQPLASGDLRVVVTPPAYAGREPAEFVNPPMVSVLEGSVVRLEVIGSDGDVWLYEIDGRQVAFTRDADRAVLTLAAGSSRPLIIRQASNKGAAADRLLHLRVARDEPPQVAIRAPGKDLLFAEAVGELRVEIDARDDVALETLALRYTRVSGSGETFTFEEGEWPLAISREGAASWRAAARLPLAGLKLEDGDTLVYRAVATDTKPGGDPAASDTYLVEIGRAAGVASTGFALPDERDRQALSQQMLIIKTERLHAARHTMTAAAFAEQAQGLAIEQRMVKAEFVFMTGGEVEDEVEEATHAHELAEGRLENTGQSELLAAIREMSRAEARLNAADTAQALPFERAALKALQRAFDRRRYLLRTLPERARIDLGRRLTGELAAARSQTVAPERVPRDPFVAAASAVLSDLGRVTSDNAAALASRLLALDPDHELMQRAALQLAAANDDTARRTAVDAAQQTIVGAIQSRTGGAAGPTLTRAPVLGRLAQELTAPRPVP